MYEKLRSKKLATGVVLLAGALGVSGCGSKSTSVSKQELKTTARLLRSSIAPTAQEIAGQVIELSQRHLTPGTQKTVETTSHGTEIQVYYSGLLLDKGTPPYKPDSTDDQDNGVTVYFQSKNGVKPTKDEVKEVIVYDYDYQPQVSAVGPSISEYTLYAPSTVYGGKKEWAASENVDGSNLVDTVSHPDDTGLNDIETARNIAESAKLSFDVAKQDFTGQ